MKRLRDGAKQSVRGKLLNAEDRAMGWLVVSLIGQSSHQDCAQNQKELTPTTGILTAIVAFCVIKVETLLFGLKFGYCGTNVLRTRSRCAGEWIAWDRQGKGGHSGYTWLLQ